MSARTITTVYGQVVKTARKSGKCPVCGRPAHRTRTFAFTVNPFNRTADGTPKTRRQVQADVNAAAAEWTRTADLRHARCMPTTDGA